MNIYIRHLANGISPNEYIGCEYIGLNIRALRIAGSGCDKEIKDFCGFEKRESHVDSLALLMASRIWKMIKVVLKV